MQNLQINDKLLLKYKERGFIMEETKKKSGFATAGLVLGIIGLCTSFIPIINNVSFILALIGGIFAIISLFKKAK